MNVVGFFEHGKTAGYSAFWYRLMRINTGREVVYHCKKMVEGIVRRLMIVGIA